MPLALPDIKDIKKFIETEVKRKKWNYRKLAEKAKIDRSTLSKILSGQVSPTYDTQLKMITVLNEGESDIKAKHVMTPKKTIATVNSEDALIRAMEKMFREDYSQLFVKNSSKIIGFIDEISVLDAIRKRENLYRVKVSRYLKSLDMPVVNSSDALDRVLEKFSNNSHVLVVNRNRIVGLITPYDLFRHHILHR